MLRRLSFALRVKHAHDALMWQTNAPTPTFPLARFITIHDCYRSAP